MLGGVIFVVFEILLVALFIRMAFDVFAIRKMLEGAGLSSDVACGWCLLPVARGAEVCGHCGRELEPRMSPSGPA